MDLGISCLWAALVAYLIARAFGQRNALRRPAAPTSAQAAGLPPLTVIVPARNESANIGTCLQALLRQDYPPERLHILLIDDDSSDDTAAIAAALARQETRLRCLAAPPLPAGWKGKPHACWVAARAAPNDSAWLCFIDADMRCEPALLSSAVQAASAAPLDLLSLAARHELRSFAERLMLPCGLYLLGFSQDLVKIQAPDSDDAVASGQFMLMRRSAYDAVRGHAAVCGAICEDVELARLLKRRGYRVRLEDGSHLITSRMYTGWRTLWPGIAKNLLEMLGGTRRALLTAVLSVLIAWSAVALPLFTAFDCAHGVRTACVATVPAAFGSAALLALHIAGALHFRVPFWYGLLFPLGYSTGLLLALDSLRVRLLGRVAWKGRLYQ